MKDTFLDGDTVAKTPNPAQHVIIVRTCISGENSQSQLINTTHALRNYGHKVTIFTASDTEELKNDLQHLSIRKVGTWIPELMFGNSKYLMYILRSMYTALRSVMFSANPRSSVIITDCSIFAMLVLMFAKRTSVIHLQNLNELVQLSNNELTFSFALQWLQTKLHSYVAEIILPSTESWKRFDSVFRNIDKSVIFYPPIDLDLGRTPDRGDVMQTESTVPENGYLLVAFGKFTAKSNLKFALATFTRVMDNLPVEYGSKMNLILTGTYNEHSAKHRKYFQSLRNLIISNEYSLNITLLRNISHVHKKELLSKCLLVLHTYMDDVFNSTILEAMCLGKPVIAIDAGFAKEVVVDQITGFLLPKDTEKFAAVIQRLIRRRILCVYLGILANQEFRNKYCFHAFAQRLNESVARNSASFWCRKQSFQTLYVNNKNI